MGTPDVIHLIKTFIWTPNLHDLKKLNEMYAYSGELRPGSKPSSFAYVKTAGISVS